MPTRDRMHRGSAAGLAVAFGLFLASSGMAQRVSPMPAAISPMPATDGLGRTLPMPGEVSGPRPGRFVGIFYFLWHENKGRKRPERGRPLRHRQDPGPGPRCGPPPALAALGADRHVPLLGRAAPRLLPEHRPLGDPPPRPTPGRRGRRHADLRRHQRPDLSRRLHRPSARSSGTIRDSGGRTPRIAFMVNTQAGATARQVYRDLYQPGKFRDLWFFWQGKPLLLCDPAEADAGAPRVLHAPQGPLALHDGQHPLRLALGGDLPPALRLHRRPGHGRAGQRLGGPEPPRPRRPGDEHERRQRPRAELPRRRPRHDARRARSRRELPGAVEAGLRSSTRRS